MKRTGNLFSQMVSFENLLISTKKAARGKKKSLSVSSFYFNLENELITLQASLSSKSYQPKGYRQFEIFEPKPRKICSADFVDRVVHHAVCGVLDPLFERRMIFDSYACRVRKGAHRAIARCQEFTRKYAYFLKCDISKYFDSIDHKVLKEILRRIIKDQSVLSLLDLIINYPVPGQDSGKGLPIGNLTSQYFANLYLGELDHFIKQNLRVKGYLRYMDDFLCFAHSKQELNFWLAQIRVFLDEKLSLKLKEKVVQIAPVSNGVPFVGFRIFPGLIHVRRENLVRFRNKIREQETKFERGEQNETDYLNSIRSRIAHLTHAQSMNLRKDLFHGKLELA
jgi:RNA-directed DNA polymerase